MPAKKTKSSRSPSKKSKKSTGGGKQKTAMICGLEFPPTRCTRLIRKVAPTDRVSANAGVAVASALEYLCAEIVEAAGDIAKEDGFKRIKPRHITLAVKSDDHMSSLFGNANFASGGVVPRIEPEVEAPAKKARKRKAKKEAKAAKGKKPAAKGKGKGKK